MAATVKIFERNGAATAASDTDKTSGTVRFKTADNATVDLANPITKPGTGNAFSFEKYLKLAVTAGTYSQLNNFEAYSDGSNGMGTGVDVFYSTTATYAQGTTGSGTGSGSLFTKTSGSPISLGTGSLTGSATGQMGNYLKLWARVASTASAGVTPGETLTFAYDEI